MLEKVIILVACATVAYVAYRSWFSKPKQPTKQMLDPKQFLAADSQLTTAFVHLKLETAKVPFDYDNIHQRVIDFLQIYLDCFINHVTVKTQFSTLTANRRTILNAITMLEVDNITVSPTVVAAFEQGTWKYIHALVKKYDLDYEYAVPWNEYVNANDLY
jgi:hypothetical protein